jgi:hypothetical protein
MVYRAVKGTRRVTIYGTYRLSTAVVTYDDSDWIEELDHLDAIIVKGTDATDRELLQRSPVRYASVSLIVRGVATAFNVHSSGWQRQTAE